MKGKRSINKEEANAEVNLNDQNEDDTMEEHVF
jgi:hypothetical protein